MNAGIRSVWVNRLGKALGAHHPAPDIELADLRQLPSILTTRD
jgi:FMN phosphatase YigB (HAD superfamily)